MQKPAMISLIMALFVLIVPVKASAEESANGGKEKGMENRHAMELFIGNTHDDGEDGATIGLSYEYRLNQLFGIGGLAEYAGMDIREGAVLVPIFWHPYKEWRFVGAPGMEFDKDEDDVSFIFRVGTAYEFEIHERWSMTPEVNVDFVDRSPVFVYGLSFGYKF